jgi:hypothetical protein
MTNICLAQEIPIELASLDNTKGPRQTYNAPEVTPTKANQEPTFDDFRHLNLNIWDLPFPGYDYWDEYANQPSCKIKIEYAGIQQVVYSQLEKLANRFYKRELSNYWNQSYLHELDLNRRMRQYGLESSDAYDHWWERRWIDSLPVEKGGQTTQTYQVGSKVEVIRIGPLSFNNEGRFSWETWRVDVEDNIDSTLTDLEAIQNKALQEKYNFGIRSPEAEYHSDWYEFRFGAKVNIRVDTLSEENKSQLGVNFKFNLLNKHQRPYLKLQASAQIQPLTGKAEFRFQLSLLEF